MSITRVTSRVLAENSVGAAQLSVGAVTNVKLAENSVGAAQLSAGAVTNVKLAADSVGTAQLSAGAVTNTKLAAEVQQLLVPVGAVMTFARNTAPTGWLICDGASLSRTVSNNAYQPLHTAIGYAFGGSGDSFNLPDLRGEFIRGWANGRNVGGQSTRVFGSAEGDAIRNLTGGIAATVQWYNAFGVFRHVFSRPSVGSGGLAMSDVDMDASRQVPTAADNRPRNIALLYCIKWN
jgi:phage-related tail fiber protein